CDERARAGAETWAGPRARADVPEALDRRGVAGTARERTPEEVLIERERAPIGVTVAQVDVQPLEIGRRDYDALEQRRLEIEDAPREPRLDAIGVALLQRVGPRAVAGVERSGGVAFHAPRQLLQLDPEHPFARGRARRVDRQGLAHDDRRLRGQQP